MSEKNPKPRPRIHAVWYIRLGIMIGAAVFLYTLLTRLTSWHITFPDHIGAPDDVMGYKDAEITSLVAGESREVRELVVYEQDIEAAMDITDMFLDIDWFRKTQTVHLTATAEYAVDLSAITQDDIKIDRNERRITITIPRARLRNVVIDYSKTTFDDIERNIFGWGDIRMTPQQQNEVEVRLQEALLEEASGTPYLASADMAAMRQVRKVYKDVLANLKNGVDIVIVLNMNVSE